MSKNPIVISVLQVLNDDGIRKRPMFVGSLDAKTLDSICDVPSFSSATNNCQIAENILNTPVKDWQRPEKPEKIRSIKNRFDQDGEFMPNPVLLAVHRDNEVEVNRATNDNGDFTGVWELTIKDPSVKDVLWILDGQHRVRGLAQTKRNTNPIPLVILHDHSAVNAYQHADFARVFSEVSTQVSPLDKLHKEWLEYVYGLGKYHDPRYGHQHKRAMETVAHLCEQRQFGSTTPTKNLFYNKVQFNPDEKYKKAIYNYGFQYSAIEYAEWIFKYYFKAVPDSVRISPLQLAEQINYAMHELISVVTTKRDDCVLWGKSGKKRTAVDRAMFIAFLVRLTKEKSPAWPRIFSNLGFGAVNWDFSLRIVTTGGDAGTTSKKVAENILKEALVTETFPSLPARGLEEYFTGDSAEFILTATDPSLSGRAKTKSTERRPYDAGRSMTFNTKKTGRAFVKIKKNTSNIGTFSTFNDAAPLDRKYHGKNLEKGIEFPSGTHTLTLEAEFFGEVLISNKIMITVH